MPRPARRHREIWVSDVIRILVIHQKRGRLFEHGAGACRFPRRILTPCELVCQVALLIEPGSHC